MSSLSYPYKNELVNSFIKAWVYIRAGDEDMRSLSVLGQCGVFGVDIDFRKYLHISTHYISASGSFPIPALLWGYTCRYMVYGGTEIVWITLADFDVEKFKAVSASPCKFPQLIVNCIDGQETPRSWHYPTIPPQPHFPTYIETVSYQSLETARVSTLSPGT